MMTLYGVYRSRASRVLWLLAECGAPFRHVKVIQAYRLGASGLKGADYATNDPTFLALNPQGQIPVFEHDGMILTESLAITQYLARICGGDLGPRDEAEAALMSQWALFAATSIETPALEIQLAYEAGAGRLSDIAGAVGLSVEKLRRPLARLEQHLAKGPWMLGERFTVADINVAECLRYAQPHAPLWDEFPRCAEWLLRAQARPAFQEIWAKRLAEEA